MAIPTREELLLACPPTQGKDRKLTEWQNSNDILSAVSRALIASKPYSRNFAHLFEEGNDSVEQVCNDLWMFMRENISFEPEPAKKQNSKRVNVILRDGYGDCKHFSTFAMAVLESLNIDCTMRVCAYWDKYGNPKKNYTHVYVVAFDEDGKEIIVDGTLPDFNEESEASKYKNINYKQMALHEITGPSYYGRHHHKLINLKKVEQAVKKDVSKVTKGVSNDVKKVTKGVANVVKKVEHVVAAVALPVARVGALDVIAHNDAHAADMLVAAWRKDPARVQKFWNAFGGNINKLKEAINKGTTTGTISGATPGQKFVAKKIPILLEEGYPLKRARAIAYDMARRKGYEVERIGDANPSNSKGAAIVNAIISLLRDMGIEIPPFVQQDVDKWLTKAKKVLAQTQAVTTAMLDADANGVTAPAGIMPNPKPKSTLSKPVLFGILGGIAILAIATSDK